MFTSTLNNPFSLIFRYTTFFFFLPLLNILNDFCSNFKKYFVESLQLNLIFRLTASGATTVDLPPGVLYRVKATYKYVREDADELGFEIGDTIQVIEYDDPEDQVCLTLMGNFLFANILF